MPVRSKDGRLPCRFLVVAICFIGSSATAQKSRKLGPDTAQAIQEAKLDPAFQTTRIQRIALFPLANTASFQEGAVVVSKALVAQLAQKHPEYKVVPPEELIAFNTANKLDDQFNVFLGDYLSSKTARQDFLSTLQAKLQVDAVLLGTMTTYGESKKRGIPLIGKKEYVVGLEMGLYRTSDGRLIWSGSDQIAANQSASLQDAAQVIGEVFARFLGRVPY